MAALKWGFIDKTGKFVIEPIFESVGDFHNGMAKFQYEGKWGYINKDGYIVIEPQYDEADGIFSEGLAWVQKGDEYLCIDKSGQRVFGDKMAEGGAFHDGLAKFGRGFINRTGRCVTGQIYDVAYPFKDGQAIVKYQGTWSCIDTSGEILFSLPKIDRLVDYSFNDGLLKVFCGNKVGFVDETGTFAISPKFEHADSFFEGLACVRYNGKFGYIDNTGKFIIEPQYNTAGRFQEGLAPASKEKLMGYIDKSGKFIIDAIFEDIEYFYGGYARVQKDGKYLVIDKTGKILDELHYDLQFKHDFQEGLAMVICGSERKYGYIDKTRKFAIEPIFDEANDFYEGLAKVGVRKDCDIHTAFENLPRRISISTSKQSVNGQKQPQKNGCYIATAVYGSYNCSEVWTLRRYRDEVLDRSWYGRLFIHIYYAISPTFVKLFGTREWFQSLFRMALNKWISRLNKKGFKNTPYNDKY